MTVVNPKSISGITSITTPSGGDNLFTIHTNDTTERLRVDSTGATKIVTGIVTTLTATTGIVTTLTSNNITGNSSIKVGTGITLSSDGDVYTTGITTLGGDSAHVTRLYVASGGNKTDPIIRVTGDTDTGIYFPTAGTIGFSVNNDESFRVDSGSRLIVGHTAATTCSDGENPFLQIKGTDSRAGASYIRHSADASASGLYLAKSRNATIGSNTIVQDDDELGRITFSGDDGTDINTTAAKIAGYVDGTPGANDMPGSLRFYTTADGASTATEKLRIGSDGNVLVGTTVSSRLLTLYGSTGIALQNSTTGTGTGNGTHIWASGNDLLLQNRENANIRFFTNDQEKMELQADGDLKLASGNVIIDTSGKGILFHPHNATGNLLDDYEEGTWSPLWSNATTGGTTCSNQMHGRYTKIGRQVIAHFYTWGLPTVGNSDAMILQGFPFASAEMSEYWGGVQAGYFNMGDDSYYNLGIALHGSTVSYGYLQFSRESGSDVAAATFNGIINGYTNFSGTISYWTS